MKKVLILSVLAITLSGPVQASECDPGVFAFEQGLYARARLILEPLAAKGDACALHYVGMVYIDGLGVKRDAKKGLALISKAEAAGYEPAVKFIKSYH